MIAQETAAKLLEDVIYSRVVECIALPRLFMVEVDLWAALSERQPGSDTNLRKEAKTVIDRALARFASADDRYAEIQPFGAHCDMCEDEELEPRKRRASSGKRAESREA